MKNTRLWEYNLQNIGLEFYVGLLDLKRQGVDSGLVRYSVNWINNMA